MQIQSSNYAKFYDDYWQTWSLQFGSDEDIDAIKATKM